MMLEPFIHISAPLLLLPNLKVVVLLQSFLHFWVPVLAPAQFHLHLTILRALHNHLSHLQLLKRLLEPVSPPTNVVLHIVRVLFTIEDDERHFTLLLGPLYVIILDDSFHNTSCCMVRGVHGHP